jgi:DNA polymerase elongation subunit (family B)
MTFNLQIVDVSEIDISINKYNTNYVIMLYCINDKSESFCIKVQNYKPFFYINFHKNFSIEDYENIVIDNKWNTKLKNKTTDIIPCKFRKLDEYQKFKTNYLKLQFRSLRHYNQVKKAFGDAIEINGVKTYVQRYESNINQFLRFFHLKDINLCKWISINKSKMNRIDDLNEQFSKCKYEFEVDFNEIHPINIDKIGPMKICSYDIECTSCDGSFPQYSRKSDEIIQIGTTIEVYGKGPEADINFIVSLKNCQEIENCEVINCIDEKELLEKWCAKINEIDPDIITGYNIWGFDYQYIYERAKFYFNHKENQDVNPDNIFIDDVLNISRIKLLSQTNWKDTEKIYIVKQLSSSAMGDNELKYLNTVGRINVDVLKYVRDNKSLPIYKLDYVAEKYIGQKKNPVSPNQIFDWYHEGKPEKITVIAKYCIQDCKLVNKLINKLSIIENSVGMSNTCWIPLNYVFTRGQGIKAQSLILKECSTLGFILPHKPPMEGDSDFKGATVLTAKSGVHYYPVSALDFASLYPSCMISHNLCISSLIKKKKLDKYIEKYNWGIDKYRKVEWQEEDITKTYYYVQPDKKNGVIVDQKRAVLPQILMKLLNKRNETKKLMKKEKDPFKKSIYDGLQLAYKITANSIYGQLGSSFGAFGKLEVAASVTTCGRQLLELAQNFTLKHYEGSVAIYGDTDSIFMKFNLKDHTDNCPYHQKNIHKRITQYHNIKNKMVQEMIDSNEEYFHSREAHAMMKTDFRLYKKCNCPQVADLMSSNALQKSIEFASEVDLIITDLLPDKKIFVNGNQVDGCQQLEYEKTYMPYILFTKKRYVGKLYVFKTDTEKDWVLDYKGIALKRRDSAEIVKKFYKKCLYKIMEGSKQIALDYLKKDLTDLMQNNKTKLYPIEDFVLSKTLKSMNKYKMDKKILQSILLLNKFLELKKLLNKKNINFEHINKLIDNVPSSSKFLKATTFEPCKHTKYDIITGEKQLSYKMNCYKCNRNVDSTFGINQLLNYLNDTYNSKVVKKEDRDLYALSTLKTYRFHKKERFDKNIIDVIDLLGEYTLDHNEKILIRVKNVLKKVSDSKIHEKIRYYNMRKVSQTHVILTKKMTARDPGSAPQINDRIQYCFIKVKGNSKNMLQGDLIENPDYIIQNKMELDYNYYIEKQIKNPLLQLFLHVSADKSKKIFKDIANINKNKMTGQRNIMDFF